MRAVPRALIWAGVAVAILLPLALAAASPLLQWRSAIYIAAGFAGIAGLALMFLQPMLAAGYLPGVSLAQGRRVHRWTGGLLVLAIAVHVGGLWLTSPPDVIDALTFTSPTPFSAWGVIAMWAILGAATLAAVRRRMRGRLRLWRIGHSSLVAIAVASTIVHALLIEGTMEVASKVALSALVFGVTAKALYDLRAWAPWIGRDRGGNGP